MSNQEAIALLRNLEDSLDSYCGLSEEGKTAFRMAIEALSNSEIPNSSDTISRKAAIEAIEELCNECDHDTTWCGDCRISHPDKDAKDVLEALPPAQPERIKGRWIHDGHHIRCDQCREYMCDKDAEGDRIPTNFCPNCGADMRGEQDE